MSSAAKKRGFSQAPAVGVDPQVARRAGYVAAMKDVRMVESIDHLTGARHSGHRPPSVPIHTPPWQLLSAPGPHR